MQQIALTSVFPRSIAWLIAPNNSEQIEKVVKYNSAALGGYFNALIPLTSDLKVSEAYNRFLRDFDADFIVLAPGMTALNIQDSGFQLYPFATLPWLAAAQIVSLHADEHAPHAGPSQQSNILSSSSLRWSDALVATAVGEHPGIDLLALVACGDVEPTRWRYALVDGDDNTREFVATGYRERFLSAALANPSRQKELAARVVPLGIGTERQIEAPSRFELASLIKSENTLSKTDPVARMRASYESQRFPITRPTFINLTASYKKREGYSKPNWQANLLPRMVLLVSDDFELEEAALFWNLRACEVYVAWISFSELEQHLDAVSAWLESDRSFIFYSLGSRSGVHFSSSDADYSRLLKVVEELRQRKTKEHPLWYLVRRENLIRYDYTRRALKHEHVVVSSNEYRASYAATVPTDNIEGYLSVVPEWNELRLPPNQSLVQSLVSSDVLGGTGHYMVSLKGGSRWETRREPISRFRVNRERRLIAQIDQDTLVQFRTPGLPEIFGFLVGYAGFDRLEPSSAARYHENFIRLANGFERAAQLLSGSPYRELLETLANNSAKNLLGDLLEKPSKRRALHHLHLRQLLGATTPTETAKYFETVSDELPEAAIHLLKHQLLERGFLLRCESCSYYAWYSADEAAQTFRCSRCARSQIYRSNPLWYYKLPEAVFQGFQDNMQVPLLALECLRKRSTHKFEWMPDSDLYDIPISDKGAKHNLDLICLVDGKIYVGEAKSNNTIPPDQFAWYERFISRVRVDGIVFATSEVKWIQGTTDRINALMTRFNGEVLILTASDLYSM